MKNLPVLLVIASLGALAWFLGHQPPPVPPAEQPGKLIEPFGSRSRVPLSEAATTLGATDAEPAPGAQPLRPTASGGLPLGAKAGPTPPGLVRIGAGSYAVGITDAQAIELIEETGLRPIASEAPQHSVELDEFLYMPTEVTNEQYLAFVHATGSRPPRGWAREGINAAELAYATDTGKSKREARDAGLPIPKFDEFDEADWWRDHWRTAAWSAPEDEAAYPVVYVTHDEAQAYANWAGLRLISEAEHQAVGRGFTGRSYPWGHEYEPNLANDVGALLGHPAPVGDFPEGSVWIDHLGHGADPDERDDLQPIHDLAGNVWEWTRSRFEAYPKFKPLPARIDGKKETVAPEFNAADFVAVGGNFGSPGLATRTTTRRGTAPWQATSGLGFRCSASVVPHQDLFDHVLGEQLATTALRTGATYSTDHAVAIERWVQRPAASERRFGRPAPYVVITDHDHLALVPAEQAEFTSSLELSERSLHLPVELGVLSTTVDLLEPPLPAGTYSLSYRAGSEPPAEDAQAAKPPTDASDASRPAILFHDDRGRLAGWLACGEPLEVRPDAGTITVHPRDLAPVATIARVQFASPSKRPGFAFRFTLPLAVAVGAIDASWGP